MPTSSGVSEGEGKATIKKDGKTFALDVEWSELTQGGADTFLHSAIQKNKNNYAIYLLDKMHDTNKHKQILMHTGLFGLTPLHHAVNFVHCNRERVELVEKMIHLCPEALAMNSAAKPSNYQPNADDQKTLAPYEYCCALEAAESKPTLETPAPPPKERGPRRGAVIPPEKLPPPKPKLERSEDFIAAVKEMPHILRLGCIQYHGHNREAITNLIGKRVRSVDFL